VHLDFKRSYHFNELRYILSTRYVLRSEWRVIVSSKRHLGYWRKLARIYIYIYISSRMWKIDSVYLFSKRNRTFFLFFLKCFSVKKVPFLVFVCGTKHETNTNTSTRFARKTKILEKEIDSWSRLASKSVTKLGLPVF